MISTMMKIIIRPTAAVRVARTAAAVPGPTGRSIGLAAAAASSSSFRTMGRSWASTLVVMDDDEELRQRRTLGNNGTTRISQLGSSSGGAATTPETTRRVVSAAMELRVSETGKDSEIHLLVLDPDCVPSQVPVGVTKIVHLWKDARTKGGSAAKAESASTTAAAQAQAIEHAVVSQADATHVLAASGRRSADALALVAKSLNVQLHQDVVEIKGRDAFVEADRGLVTDHATRRLLTINSYHFAPADLQDVTSVPVEVLLPPSRASQLLWKVVPAGFVVAVLLCAI